MNMALRPLRMATKLDAIDQVPKWCWSHGWWRRHCPASVTDASQWMSKPPLFARTRTPRTVGWPDWWKVKPEPSDD